MENIKNGKLLYHLTKLSNLDSIINRGLVSRSELEHDNVNFDDVADSEIMRKRKEFNLDAYIPFHFHPYSSFDVAVKNTYNEEFIYICITRIFASNNKFLILPKHPLSEAEVTLLDYDTGIEKIDWHAMNTNLSQSCLSPLEANYIRQVRMAECLTERPICVNDFNSIVVRNQIVKNEVEQKLQHVLGRKPYVNIQPWFKNID